MQRGEGKRRREVSARETLTLILALERSGDWRAFPGWVRGWLKRVRVWEEELGKIARVGADLAARYCVVVARCRVVVILS